MSVNSHLLQVSSNLVLSASETTTIRTSINTLSARLSSYFGNNITSQFQFGSSTRGTILPRSFDSKSDIDYMVVFNTAAGQMKPQTYLEQLKGFAQKHYSSSSIKQSHPTLVLSLGHIHFELVPAIHNYGYYIPSPASHWSEWMVTDPNGTNEALTRKNGENNSQIKPLVRLVKYWNARHDHPFASFDLEQWIVNQNYFSCSALKDYFYAFWTSFDCSYQTAAYIKSKVAAAKQIAARAKQLEGQGYGDSAELEIRKLVP